VDEGLVHRKTLHTHDNTQTKDNIHPFLESDWNVRFRGWKGPKM